MKFNALIEWIIIFFSMSSDYHVVTLLLFTFSIGLYVRIEAVTPIEIIVMKTKSTSLLIYSYCLWFNRNSI